MKLIEKFKKQLPNEYRENGFITTKQLNSIGIKNYEIKRLCDYGELIKLRKSYYKLRCSKKINYENLILSLYPEAVFCLRYVLWLRGLRKRKVYDVAIPRNTSYCKKAKIEGIDLVINFHYIPGNIRDPNLGFRTQNEVPYFHIGRTMCDMFKYQQSMGTTDRWLRDLCFEFHGYIGDEKTDKVIKKIKLYSENMHMTNEAKRKLDRMLIKRLEKKKAPTKCRYTSPKR